MRMKMGKCRELDSNSNCPHEHQGSMSSSTNLFLMLTSSLHNIYDLEDATLMRAKIY